MSIWLGIFSFLCTSTLQASALHSHCLSLEYFHWKYSTNILLDHLYLQPKNFEGLNNISSSNIPIEIVLKIPLVQFSGHSNHCN